MLLRSVFVALVVNLPAVLALPAAAGSDDPRPAILVTGASSGIGRQIAETLAEQGFFVFAGARKPEDIAALSEIPDIEGIRLDVTIPSEIDAAVARVRASGKTLHGLVNNAGVLITGPSIEVDVDTVRWMFDVNVFGVYRVTQAFAPLLIESRGRIVMISSIAGNIGIRYLGAYSMTKHAIEAYTDSLALEMARFGVHVSAVAPGTYATNIWNSDIAKARAKQVVADDSPYAADYRDWIEIVAALELEPPDEVAAVVHEALASEFPRRRYLVVPNQDEMDWVFGSAARRLAELNIGHRFAYSEPDIQQILREAAAGSDHDK